MISVVYAAGIVVAVTLVGMAVDWRRLGSRCSVAANKISGSRTRRTVTAGRGYRLITDSRLEVSSTQVYSNGTTQIWLKRRPAA